MKSLGTFTLSCFLLLPFVSPAQELKKMENEVKSSGRRENNLENSISNDDWQWALIEIFFNFGFYPTYGLLFGFREEPRPNDASFNEYPYADYSNGIFNPPDWLGRTMRTEAVLQFQNNEDAISGVYAQVKFHPVRSVALDLNHLRLLEVLEDGSSDHLGFTNVNIQFNRIRHPKFHLWWGGGLTMLHADRTYAGPGLTGGFTWYIRRPVSLHAHTQIGWASGTYIRQHHARLQMHLKRFLVFAGYQGTRTGDIRLPNWALGSGIWF